jgi:GH25 family lysozyme M1 (1,4-beta-N-acetylmuramidase)
MRNRIISGVAAAAVLGTAVQVGSAVQAAPSPSGGLKPGEGFAGAGLGRPAQPSVRIQRAPGPGISGIDVSAWQKDVDWRAVAAGGVKFAYVKATESVTYRNPYFAGQYGGSYQAGLVRGAYHFAQPHESSGAAQADYFVANGGRWSRDGRTLPGALDLENNPYGSINHLDTCYSMTPQQLRAWVNGFTSRYFERTGRRPVIYTNTAFWQKCVADSRYGDHGLWLARWNTSPGPLPVGWQRQTFWQYANSGAFPGDQNLYSGTVNQLRAWAKSSGAKAVTSLRGVNAAPEPIRKGRKVTVTGKLSWTYAGTTRPVARQQVVFYFKAKGARKWTRLGVATTGPKGGFSRRFVAKRDGWWTVTYFGSAAFAKARGYNDFVDVR